LARPTIAGRSQWARRAKAAAIVEDQFDDVVETWARAVEQTFEELHELDRVRLANSLVRFSIICAIPPTLPPSCICGGIVRTGMLARAKPSQFNVFTSR